MRADTPGGRFTVESEIDRYWDGIREDLQRPAGGELPWFRYNALLTEVDDVYDIGDSAAGGLHFDDPRMVKYITAQVFQGQTTQNDRGFYNTDLLRLSMSMADFVQVFPEVTPLRVQHGESFDVFLKDRVKFQGKVFRPSRVFPRGLVKGVYAVITMDLTEVKGEEMYFNAPMPW